MMEPIAMSRVAKAVVRVATKAVVAVVVVAVLMVVAAEAVAVTVRLRARASVLMPKANPSRPTLAPAARRHR